MIEFKGDKSKIEFNNAIYFPEVLGQAVEDYSSAFKIKLIKEGLFSFVVIDFSGCSENGVEITYEFCNYALALMKDKFVESAHYVKNG
jgi:hypothetical protein